MRKILFAGISALSLIAAPAANADGWRHHGYYGHRGHGDAVAAGVVGLAFGALIGSAIANDHNRRAYSDDYYADRRYYRDERDYDRYDDEYDGGQCFRRELRWDPRTRTNIEVTHAYPC